MIVWHYTTREKLDAIIVDGHIVPAYTGVDYPLSDGTRAKLEEIVASDKPQPVAMEYASGEVPAVWFSKRSTWEPTATKGIMKAGVRRRATIEEMVCRAGGLARIGVDSNGLRTWVEHRTVGGITRAEATRLVRSGTRVGANPGDWFVAYASIPRDRWLAVEESRDGTLWAALVGRPT